jgi:hypothetical protein
MILKGTKVAAITLAVASLGIPSIPASGKNRLGRSWTASFPVEEFSTVGSNEYFILEPGHTLVLEGRERGKALHLTITVLENTRVVDGVETRVVRERELLAGELIEESLNYFAIGRTTNTVYYFGEDVDFYENGQIVNHDGSWRSGVGGARYGVLMPGLFLLGAKYYQEVAPEIALDRAENLSISESITTTAGTFVACAKVRETTPLDPSAKDFKYYAPGIGLVKSNSLVLTSYTPAPKR